MDTASVYHHLENLLSLQQGVLKGSDELEGYPRWDSLTILEYMELVDNSGRQLRPAQIMACRTVDDLVQLTVHAFAADGT